MNIEDKILTINNNEYIVIDTIDLDNKKYAYLVNTANELDSMFKEVIINEEEMHIESIDKDLFTNKIYPLFIEKFKNY